MMARYVKGQGKLFRKRKNGKPVGSWFFKYDGREINTKTQDKTDAERVRAVYVGRAAEGFTVTARPKVNALLDGVVDDYKLKGRTSGHTLQYRLKPLRAYFGSMDAQTLPVRSLKGYREKRRQEGLSDTGIDRELEVLRRAFNIALTEESVSRAPSFKTVMSGRDNVRTGYLDPADYERLRDAMPEPIRLMLVIGSHIGWRAGRIQGLTWEQVDLEQGIIRPPGRQQENKTVGMAPVYGDLLKALHVARLGRDRDFPQCPWVVHRSGRKVVEYLKAWNAGVAAAELDGLHFHDLRRTAVRNLLSAGIPEGRVMKIVGHKTRSMLDRYDIVDEKATAKMARELDQKATEEAAKTADGAHFERTRGANGVN